jgi:hypothetical protein
MTTHKTTGPLGAHEEDSDAIGGTLREMWLSFVRSLAASGYDGRRMSAGTSLCVWS